MEIAPYRKVMVELIEAKLALLEPMLAEPSQNDKLRMKLVLQEAASTSLREMAIECQQINVAGGFWQHGPEIQLPDWPDSDGVTPLKRLKLMSVGHGRLSNIQEMLVLELQVLVLTCLESLGQSGDTILDLSSGNFGRWIMARLAMHVAGRDCWKDPHFWDGYIDAAGIFNTRLLGNLERMLSRTYENKPATTSVILVANPVAKALRWSNWLVQAPNLFEGEKMGLHLSDSESTSFVFEFTGSEFLGIYDTLELQSRYLGGDVPHFRWRVFSDSSIEGSMDGNVCVSYSQGQWRIIDLERAYERISRIEPSLSEANRRIWELCVRQSKNREGCLILIANDPEQLVKDQVVRASEINTCSNRIRAVLGDEPAEPVLNPGFFDVPIKSVFLEQFRGKRVNDIPVTVLSSLARVDGALVVSSDGLILGFGIILRPPVQTEAAEDRGARTAAARGASRYGLSIKVSDDGPISGFRNGEQIA